MGAMSLPQFELKHNLFAKEMRKVDPSIKLIAGGAMPDVMEGADQARRINGQYVPDYLSAADWTGQMLLQLPRQHRHGQRALLRIRHRSIPT